MEIVLAGALIGVVGVLVLIFARQFNSTISAFWGMRERDPAIVRMVGAVFVLFGVIFVVTGFVVSSRG